MGLMLQNLKSSIEGSEDDIWHDEKILSMFLFDSCCSVLFRLVIFTILYGV